MSSMCFWVHNELQDSLLGRGALGRWTTHPGSSKVLGNHCRVVQNLILTLKHATCDLIYMKTFIKIIFWFLSIFVLAPLTLNYGGPSVQFCDSNNSKHLPGFKMYYIVYIKKKSIYIKNPKMLNTHWLVQYKQTQSCYLIRSTQIFTRTISSSYTWC